MRPFVADGEMIRRAVALQVLDPEDVHRAGGTSVAAQELRSRLEKTGWLSAPVIEALARLIELRPSASGGVKAQTERPDTGAADLNLNLATLDAEGEKGEPPAPAPEPEAGPKLNLDVQTLGGDEGAAPPAPSALSGELSTRGDSLTAGGEEPDTPSAEEADELVDLSVLDPPRRSVLEQAAFARVAVRLGFVTHERARALSPDPDHRIEDVLVAEGALAPSRAMMVREMCQSTRPVCVGCYGVMTAGSGRCPLCGRPQRTTTGSGSGGSRGARAAHGGIEGFPQEGGTFAGYELLSRVAEGGMGVVFRARQTALNRIVALKVLRGGALATKARRRRFLQEAEAAAALKHPSIVAVFDIDEVAGYPFYTMDFVEGPTLDRHVIDRKPAPREIAALVRSVADGVQHFHLHGIIHRDLKPDNILVGEDGIPRIIDFGIAKRTGEETEGATVDGAVLGTPHYMSPEQAAGRVREVDTRTDVYALGTILYELLTGAPPWAQLSHAALVVAIQEEDPPPMRAQRPEVDGDLEAIVQKAMAKERERRYLSAAELAEDLERYLAHQPIRARPATLFYRLKKTLRRRYPAVLATAVSLAVVLAALGKWAWDARERGATVRRDLLAAEDQTRQESEREELYNAVLALEPENVAARNGRELIVVRREEKTRRMESEVARQRALSDARAAEARELERQNAEKERAKQAELLLAGAEAASGGDPLRAIADLQDALAILPRGPSELRSRIEARKVDVALRLAREAVKAQKADLAAFWLLNTRLDAARARTSDIDAVAAEVSQLTSGRRDLAAAHELAKAGQWLAARNKLEQARSQGVAPEALRADEALVEARCAALAGTLVAEGQALLQAGKAAGALSRANEARELQPRSEAVGAFAAACEQRVTRDAQREAASLFLRPEDRSRSLSVLEQASNGLRDRELLALLVRERGARHRLATDPALEGLVFLPELSELQVKACYVERIEVTNAAFKAFVDAGGYEAQELWDEAGRRLLATFRDGCPGDCRHKGPRTWINGGFGDPGNADRPVRGVTVHEARAFARWRSRTRGGTWRLPSEREWEATAGWDPATGKLRLYPWGDVFDPQDLAIGAELPHRAGTTRRDRSALGLLDAGGNVLEWVDRPGRLSGTKGADFASHGAFAKHAALVGCTGEPGAEPAAEFLSRIGFRLVREIEVER